MIEFALPEIIQNRDDLGNLVLEGSLSFGKFSNDVILAKWTLDNVSINVVINLAERTITVPNNTSKTRQGLIDAEINKHNNRQKVQASIQALCDKARSGIGLPMEQLSKPESDAIIKLLLLNQRALEFDENGEPRIKPFEKWVKHLKNV